MGSSTLRSTFSFFYVRINHTMMIFLLTSLTVSIMAVRSMEDDWVGGWLKLHHSAYYASPGGDQKSLTDAENFCVNHRSKLFVLDSARYEEDFYALNRLVPVETHYWIGLVAYHNGETNERTWRWLDGTDYEQHLSFLRWSNSTSNRFEECVTIYRTDNTTDYELHRFPCSQNANFICESLNEPDPQYLDHDLDLDPPPTPVLWQCVNDRCCYAALTTQKYTFSEAKLACHLQNSSAHLPTFNESTDWFSFLAYKRASVGYNATWLGYQDRHVDGVWQTYDNKDPVFTRFEAGHPSNFLFDCATSRGLRDFYWQEDICTDKHYTICQMCFDDPMRHSHEKCPAGWKYYPNSSSCYYISSERYENWFYAENVCRLKGGDLLTLKSVEETEFVRQQMAMGLDYWIGLTPGPTINGVRNWTWIDGSPLDTSVVSWRPGEPNNATTNDGQTENCAEIREEYETTSMNDVPCRNPYPPWLICKKPVEFDEPTEPTISCPENWFHRTETPYCYYYSDELVTFDEADSVCKSSDANLISFHSIEEANFIGNKIQHSHKQTESYWVGLRPFETAEISSKLMWTDGLPFDKTELKISSNWFPDKRHYNEERYCTAIRNLKDLIKISCAVSHNIPFICSKPSMAVGNKTVCQPKWLNGGNLNKCYILANQTDLCWTAANKYCISVGGVLLTLHADKELEYLRSNKQLAAETYLIGLYNPGDLYEENTGEHRWQWHDGLLYSSSDNEIISWEPGEPTLSIYEEPCVSASASVQPAMSTVNCTEKLRFICKLNAGREKCTVRNTVWSECQAAENCNSVCGDDFGHSQFTCVEVCQSGCVCAKGYVRASATDNKCVAKEDCEIDESHKPVRVHKKPKPTALLGSCLDHPHLSFHINNDCYRVITRSLNFRMAEEFCFAYGGFLAITDGEEQIGKLTPFLNQLRIPYVRVGLQRNTFGSWDWGLSRWPYRHILSPKISSATATGLPWLPDSVSSDRSSVKTTGLLSVCVNDYSSPKNCRSGLIEASPNEEFPVLCQFDLDAPESKQAESTDYHVSNSMSSVTTLALLCTFTTVCMLVMIWMHISRRMANSVANRLTSAIQRRTTSSL